jgi:hypothetical protein
MELMPILFNMFVLLFALAAMMIVAMAAHPLAGAIKQGMLFLLWGLGAIVMSFFAAFWGLGQDVQMFMLSIGMVFILVSSHRLFSLYRPDNL